jgi:hypothetical protein
MSLEYLHVQHMSMPARDQSFQLRAGRDTGTFWILERLITYSYRHIESSIRPRRLSILERSKHASSELCSIRWMSSYSISLSWRRETASQ